LRKQRHCPAHPALVDEGEWRLPGRGAKGAMKIARRDARNRCEVRYPQLQMQIGLDVVSDFVKLPSWKGTRLLCHHWLVAVTANQIARQ
jgi:hypothetical protein